MRIPKSVISAEAVLKVFMRRPTTVVAPAPAERPQVTGTTGWNADAVEEIAETVVERHLAKGPLGGGLPVLFESRETGVVAFERMRTRGRDDLDWTACAQDLADATGLAVLCVADCEWCFDDRCDEEATYVAFDVPGVAADYAESGWRNKLKRTVRPTPKAAQ